jgi:RHS repeat-associated protein
MGRFQWFALIIAAFLAIALTSAPGEAKNIGADPPLRCSACGCGAPSGPGGNCSSSEPCRAGACFSRTEGNVRVGYPVVSVRSSTGAMLDLSLTYDSYNADTSRARFNTVLGIGWTHSYNLFLFSQVGNMFRVDGDGRVTKYQLGPGGKYTAAPGYFETIVKNSDGSFTVTDKYQTKTLYAQLPPPGTPFMKGTPVWRLQSITDRNGNVTQLTYDSSGNLTKVTDTYTRTISFQYNSHNLITAITDPLNRTTNFIYDSTGTQLATIPDPAGKTTQYTYNLLSQLTSQSDKDGRVFTYSYTNAEPSGFTDGSGAPYFSMANPNNWATDQTQLALNQVRQYLPSTTSKTDGNGNVWKYSYDQRGYVTGMIAPDSATWTYTYDPVTLMPASQTDPNGNTTRYQYDAQGNLIQKTDASPFNFVTTYTYEPVFNQITSMTDPNGRVTTYTYDARGNRLSETDTQTPPATGSWTYDSHGNMTSETDKRGNPTFYLYDAFGNRIQTKDREGNLWQATYDAVGNVITRTDPLLHVTQYAYDKLDRLTTETKPLGDPLQADTLYFYDNEGDRKQVIDRDGNPTSYDYDQRRRLVTITDAQTPPKTTVYTYDNNDNRISLTDKNVHTTNFGYDLQNRLSTTTDAENNTSSTKYDGVGNKISETDANGHTTFYDYDSLNRVIDRTDAEGFVTVWKYDMTGAAICSECTGPTLGSTHITEQIDGNGKVIYFTYDGVDRLDREIRKQGATGFNINPGVDAVTVYAYDPNGNRIAVTEPDGNTTTYAYDKLDRQIRMIVHVGSGEADDVTSTTYDPDGNVATVTTPNLNVTTNTYDSLDRLMQVDDLIGRVANYTYDPVGNRLTQRDGNGNGTDNKYDAVYRITDITDALGKTTHYDHDAVGNLLDTMDREGHITKYFYDKINRRIETIDALGNVTDYHYDGVGNLTHLQITDAVDGKVEPTDYTYDKINRLKTETYPDGGVRSFNYDAVSLLSRTDQNGNVTSYTYSDLYFLTQRSYSLGPPDNPPDNMTYDLSGRMLRAERGGWVVTFAYDGADRVLKTTQNAQTISYTYDIPARIETITYPSGRTITQSTDFRGRLSRIDDGSSATPIVKYSYDLGDRVVQRDYRNATTADYSYNNNDWITDLQHSSAVPIAGFGYTYDNEGNKNFEQKLQDLGHSELYLPYDPIYRLTDFKVGTLNPTTMPPSIAMPVTQTHWDLDGLGNWADKIKDGVTETRMHNTVNEITKINGSSICATPPCYDNNGNLLADALNTYRYDQENRLLKVIRNAGSVVLGQFQYDALSRRVQKIANTTTTTRYFYDDARIVEEQDGSGTTQATYVYGNYVDEVLTMDRGGQPYYYHQNALWSVEAITDRTAGVVESNAYDAYGMPTTLTSPIGNPYLFTGRQLDAETGIYFYRARYYDPVKGRFLQREPEEYLGSMNLYAYVNDYPTHFADPEGLAPLNPWTAPYLCCRKWEKVYQLWKRWGLIATASAHCCAWKLTNENPFADFAIGPLLAGGGWTAEKLIEKGGNEILKKTAGGLASVISAVGWGINIGLVAAYPINYSFCDAYMCSDVYLPKVTTGTRKGAWHEWYKWYDFTDYVCGKEELYLGSAVRTWHSFKPGTHFFSGALPGGNRFADRERGRVEQGHD